MATTTEQEILQREEQLADAKRALDLKALDRIYADDIVMTGVLGEPTCSKAAMIEEVKRGIAEREKAIAGGMQVEMSAVNEDMMVKTHGDTAIANYRFVVKCKGPNIDLHRRYRITNIWKKRDGHWQIVATHGSFVLDPKQAAMITGEAPPPNG
jgi:ketosteroid isomerase-like protein